MSSGSVDASLTAKIQILNASLQSLEDVKRQLKEVIASLKGTGSEADKVKGQFTAMGANVSQAVTPFRNLEAELAKTASGFRSASSSAVALLSRLTFQAIELAKVPLFLGYSLYAMS